MENDDQSKQIQYTTPELNF